LPSGELLAGKEKSHALPSNIHSGISFHEFELLWNKIWPKTTQANVFNIRPGNFLIIAWIILISCQYSGLILVDLIDDEYGTGENIDFMRSKLVRNPWGCLFLDIVRFTIFYGEWAGFGTFMFFYKGLVQ
jgi:hypothetical protein